MKVLIVTQYFWPENFKVNDIAEDLVKRGHEVTVLTAKPNYPAGKFYDGYSFWNNRNEQWKDVNVVRCPIISRGNSNISLMLNYVSFVFFASLAVIFRLKKDADVIFVHEVSPIFVGIPAIIYKKLTKKPIYFWVLDLWPETLRATLGIRKGFIYNVVDKIVKYIYNNSDIILVSSKGFKESIRKYVKGKEIQYFPNWAEDIFLQTDFKTVKKLPDGFNVMFAGNIGESQNFRKIIEAAEHTKDDGINWIIIGDGRRRKWLEEQIEEKNIHNLYVYGRYPLEDMPSFFKNADVMLVSLKYDEIFKLTIPAKIQTYLAASKIIVGLIDGEAKLLIENSGGGIVCNSNDSKCLSERVRDLSNLDKSSLLQMESNSKKYYTSNFDKDMLITQLITLFEKSLINK